MTRTKIATFRGAALGFATLGSLILLGAIPAEAQPRKGWSGYLSLGGAFAPDYEGSADYRPLPFGGARVGYDAYYAELRGPALRANVMPAGFLPFGLELGPVVGYRFGRDDVADDRVDALRDIDGSVTLGGFVKVSTPLGLLARDQVAFEVESQSGVGGESKGTTVGFGPSYGFSPTDALRLGIGAKATYAGGGYAETFFSVDGGNAARSGLDVFDADGGIKDIGLTLTANYRFTETWGLTGILGVSRLVGDAAESPIVEDSGSPMQGFGALGLSYSF